MSKQLYFKITNAEENHNGFQYVDGLNVLDKDFDEEGSCVKGGLYFSEVKHILKFVEYGIYVREITLPDPKTDPDFKMVQDPAGDKYRANKIILGKRLNLSEVSTFEYLISLGASLQPKDAYSLPIENEFLHWASAHGYLDVVKFFIARGADPKHNNGISLRAACAFGHLDIIKFFIEKGCDHQGRNLVIIALENGHIETVKFFIEKGCSQATYIRAMMMASEKGYLEIVKLLIEKEINRSTLGLCVASRNGHLDIVKFLIEKGADLFTTENYPLRSASENGHLDVVKYLIEKGADSTAKNNYAVRQAARHGHLEVVKFLINHGADVYAENNYAIKWAFANKKLEVYKFLISLEQKIE